VSDWRDVGTVLLGSWPSQVASWGREAIAAYVAELQARGMTPDQAIVVFRSSDERFPPSAAEAASAARRDVGRPTWDEAYILIRRAMRQHTPNGRYDSERQILAARHQRMQDWLAGVNSFVAGFTAQQTFSRLTQLPLDDPEWGEKTKRDLERAYDRYRETSDSREVALIASGHPGELGRLDPLAALELAKPAQLPERAA
jgi:hypothetical protein